MTYNPKIHHRQSIRLKGYDYSKSGAYFITICCHNRKCLFGRIENHKMIMNENGIISYDEWMKLSKRFSNFELDVFQIMPNHIHGIIKLHESIVGAGFTSAENNAENIDNGGRVNRTPTIGDIVGAYKSLVTNICLEIYKTKNEMMGKLWQRNYHEHIIRNEQSYKNISDYIINNPKLWMDDKFHN